jgi:hypothetical protein
LAHDRQLKNYRHCRDRSSRLLEYSDCRKQGKQDEDKSETLCMLGIGANKTPAFAGFPNIDGW